MCCRNICNKDLKTHGMKYYSRIEIKTRMTDVLYIYLKMDRYSCREKYAVVLYTIIEFGFGMKMLKF